MQTLLHTGPDVQLNLDPYTMMHALEGLLGCIHRPFSLNVNSLGNMHGCFLKGLFLITNFSGYFSPLHAVKSIGKSDFYMDINNLQHTGLKKMHSCRVTLVLKQNEKNIYTAN